MALPTAAQFLNMNKAQRMATIQSSPDALKKIMHGESADVRSKVLGHAFPAGVQSDKIDATKQLKEVGTVVVIEALMRRPDLNFRCGRVTEGLDIRSGRAKVAMLSSQETFGVLAKNLLVLALDDDVTDEYFNPMTTAEKKVLKAALDDLKISNAKKEYENSKADEQKVEKVKKKLKDPQGGEEAVFEADQADEAERTEEDVLAFRFFGWPVIGENLRDLTPRDAMPFCTTHENDYGKLGLCPEAAFVVAFLEKKVDFILFSSYNAFLKGKTKKERFEFQKACMKRLERDGPASLMRYLTNQKRKKDGQPVLEFCGN